ncbi:putative ribonuclease H-like domain-containing protein [Tanacetum coccineum]|uniref:Ribonuclease H-like domain-containing protein n=1 Tax=Tanacetum coccineum TaxID=301880 RepID=A0ABQ4Y690_9ASTR
MDPSIKTPSKKLIQSTDKGDSRSSNASCFSHVLNWSRKSLAQERTIRTSSKARSIETSDGLAAIQAQLNNLGREIKKVHENVYAAQVGCELCKGPHYTKDCPLKEEGKTLKEAYYTQFGAPYQPGGQYRAAGLGFYQHNNINSSYPD